MNHNILVIDDEWSDRSPAYDEFAEEITKRYPGFEIVFFYQKKDDRADLKMKFIQNQFSAVITDAVLTGKWHNISIRDVVEIVNEKIPMAVVSDRWDETNAQDMMYAWKKPNCRTFLHWRDIDIKKEKDEQKQNAIKGQIQYAIESMVYMLADRENLDPHLNLDSDEDLRIVHISDLHTKQIGSEQDEDAVQRIFNKAQTCASVILNHWENKPPAFIAFTGDVSDYGSPTQYEMTRKWIQYFCRSLDLGELPARNVLYVPGNHDVNLRLAASARISIQIDESGSINPKFTAQDQQPELIKYASVPFRNYLSKITDCPLLDHDIDANQFGWLEARFRHLGAIFYGVNTSEPSSSALPDRKVNVGVLRSLGERLREIRNSQNADHPPIVIGLGHHSPVAEADDGAVRNLRDFKEFFQGNGKTHIFLHGHSHEHIITDESIGDERLIRSGAPSFTQPATDRPEDTFRGFNLLTLTRRSHVITSLKIDSFGWIGTRVQCIDNRPKTYIFKDDNFKEM